MSNPTIGTKEDRRHFIGASEAAAALNLNPFHKPPALWTEKVVGVEEDEKEDTLASRLGTMMEPVIAELYIAETGAALLPEQRFVHPRIPWLAATPDRIVAGVRVVEMKHPGMRQMFRWGTEPEDVPDEYRVQVVVQMACTDLPEADLVCLLPGPRFQIYRFSRDLSLEKAVLDGLEKFWDLVVRKIPPAIDGSEESREMIRSLFPENNGLIIAASPAADRWASQYHIGHAFEKKGKELKAEAANHLKFEIGDNDGIDSALWKASNKKTKGSIDWEAFSVSIRSGVRNWIADPHVGDLDKILQLDPESFREEGSRRFDFRLKRGITELPEPQQLEGDTHPCQSLNSSAS